MSIDLNDTLFEFVPNVYIVLPPFQLLLAPLLAYPINLADHIGNGHKIFEAARETGTGLQALLQVGSGLVEDPQLVAGHQRVIVGL